MAGQHKPNPRRSNGSLRNRQRAYLRRTQDRCAICGGPLDWSIKWDRRNPSPLYVEIDEKVPVSRWFEAGYLSPQQCAQDFGNIQAVHRICNERKGNRMARDSAKKARKEASKALDVAPSQDWLS